MTLIVDRSARNLSPGPLPSIADEVRRLTAVSYDAGRDAGRADAVAHLRPLISDVLGDLRYARQQRNHSQRELSDHRVWDAVADRHAGHLIGLLAVARALKEGAHR